MSHYVTDTHAFLWYLGGSSQLSATARTIFDEAADGMTDIFILAIVLAEAAMLIEKRRIRADFSQIITKLKSVPYFHLTSLTSEIVTRIPNLVLLPDIHDRLIVAEALELKSNLITRDKLIAQSQIVPVVW